MKFTTLCSIYHLLVAVNEMRQEHVDGSIWCINDSCSQVESHAFI